MAFPYAIIRRREFAGGNLLRSNGIEINLPVKSVSVKGRPVVLTRTEYELLLFFIGNAGKVVSSNCKSTKYNQWSSVSSASFACHFIC